MCAAPVVPRESAWRVHRFEVWSGERVCCVEALRTQAHTLLWLGGGGGEARLGELALATPGVEGAGGAATTLLGGGHSPAAQLALRLATTLARPVLVSVAVTLDRFTTPLVEQALKAEIKSRPDCF